MSARERGSSLDRFLRSVLVRYPQFEYLGNGDGAVNELWVTGVSGLLVCGERDESR